MNYDPSTLTIQCECQSPRHAMTFTLHDWVDEEPELYVTYYLDSDVGFWNRLKIGIRFIFGYKCEYGHFGSTLITPKSANILKGMIDEYLQASQRPVPTDGIQE